MKLIVTFAITLFLSGCATPQHIMVDKQGKAKACGGGYVGSVLGGRIGYEIEKQNDEKCQEDLKKKGYKEQ